MHVLSLMAKIPCKARMSLVMNILLVCFSLCLKKYQCTRSKIPVSDLPPPIHTHPWAERDTDLAVLGERARDVAI